ncbi:MAG: metal-dependent hydrolase [bacterium]|nr:metal-dependent hydrolase [bacterium]
MHIATHLFASWLVADAVSKNNRERLSLTVSGLIPDMDVLPAAVTAITGGPQKMAETYQQYHHVLAHNFTVALVIGCVALILNKGNCRVAFWAFIIFHLHLLADILGSAGPNGSIWSIKYLYPFSHNEILFQWQWVLNSWQNITITIVLIAGIIYTAKIKGYSLISLLSKRADRIFVETLRNRL